MHDNAFDLIVSDIMMPGINEFEFARSGRKYPNSVYDSKG